MDDYFVKYVTIVSHVSAFSIQSYWKAPRRAGPFSIKKGEEKRKKMIVGLVYVINNLAYAYALGDQTSQNRSHSTTSSKIRKSYANELTKSNPFA